MNDLLIKLLFTILGLYVGVLTWLGKTAWSNLKETSASIETIRLNCAICQKTAHEDTSAEIQELLDQISTMIDKKLDAWWYRIENNLMNDGRLPPKRRQKHPED